MILGERVLAKREELGISQRELAERAGITGSYVSHIELGDQCVSNPTVKVVMGLAKGLGVKVGHLVGEPMHNTDPRAIIRSTVTRSQILQAVRDLIVDAERTFDYRQWSLYDAETFEAAARLIRDGYKKGESPNG